MFLAVVLAALVIGAGMVSIPLLLLLSRLGKSSGENIDLEKLVTALLRERATAAPATEPVSQRIAPPLPAPLRIVPATIPAATPTSAPDSIEAELVRNILAENLSVRESDAPMNV